jgi:hypothetical protein
MNKTLPFGQLDQLLQRLGFEKTVLPTFQLVYQHQPSNTILYFRAYQPDEAVSPTDLAVARKYLTERGLMEARAFDRLPPDTPA